MIQAPVNREEAANLVDRFARNLKIEHELRASMHAWPTSSLHHFAQASKDSRSYSYGNVVGQALRGAANVAIILEHRRSHATLAA